MVYTMHVSHKNIGTGAQRPLMAGRTCVPAAVPHPVTLGRPHSAGWPSTGVFGPTVTEEVSQSLGVDPARSFLGCDLARCALQERSICPWKREPGLFWITES